MNLRECLLTKNDCYKAGKTIVPKGVMIHSTGANNKNVSRYVPGDGVIGINTAGNHWNRAGLNKCVHAFVGRFQNGRVGVVQTLPWDCRGWHAGGSANNTHIGFEICEDDLTDASYFRSVYQEAVSLTAMLCEMYGLNPLEDGVVICHSEGCARGIASNHADVMHWFPKHGKNMDTFRNDVAKAMKVATVTPKLTYSKTELPVLSKGVCCEAVEILQLLLFHHGFNPKEMTGEWRSGTEAAFRAWQKSAGLTVDGSCGPKSWAKLIGG